MISTSACAGNGYGRTLRGMTTLHHHADTAHPTIVLFDIDGTLITTGGGARAALLRAVEARFGDPAAFSTFSYGGMTDRGIFRRGLDLMGVPVTDALVDELIVAYLDGLEAALRAGPVWQLHPGAEALVRRVAALNHVAAGLGTGNVEAGARAKIAPFGLNSLLPFGGFGCDGEARDTLIATGARRGAERLGLPLADCDLVIIGDTPRDIASAHANGGRCVAVATGGASRAQLAAAGADALFDQLDEPGVFEAVLGLAPK